MKFLTFIELYFDGNPMGWDGTGMNCYGMGWDRKICPMDKSGNNGCSESINQITMSKKIALFNCKCYLQVLPHSCEKMFLNGGGNFAHPPRTKRVRQ